MLKIAMSECVQSLDDLAMSDSQKKKKKKKKYQQRHPKHRYTYTKRYAICNEISLNFLAI